MIRTQKSFAYEATALTVWLMVLNLIEQTLKSLSLIYFKTNEFIPHIKRLMRLHQAVADHLYIEMLTIAHSIIRIESLCFSIQFIKVV